MSDNSNSTPALPPAGWYPDPEGGFRQRYWDGAQWAAVEAGPEVAIAGPRRPRLRWWQWALIALGAVILLSVIAGMLGGGRAESDAAVRPASSSSAAEPRATKEPSPEPVMVAVPNVVGMDGAAARAALEALGFRVAHSGDETMPVISQDAAEGAELEKGSTVTLTHEEKPTLTRGQENAIKSATSYLGFSAFSRAGLFQQLTSQYGEGFEAADAEFAIAHLEQNGLVDWNAEAAESAQSYLDFTSFSRQGLYDQLTSQYGEGFTHEQAEYALAAVGY